MPSVHAYADPAVDSLYQLLFADDLAAFPSEGLSDAELSAIADDVAAESRLRVVAYRRLRSIGRDTDGPLLGVVVEVGLDAGLDTLAAYVDGRVRYINHSGAMSIVEDPAVLAGPVMSLLAAAEVAAAASGPWDGHRLPPPSAGSARLTMLVGGRLHFGQGQIEQLTRDPLAGPVLQAASTLLSAVVGLSVEA
jgi:hypothetical protein